MKYIIDESGRQVYCAINAYYFAEGLCAVQVGGKWGFINRSAKLVIPCQYDSVWSFEDGAAVVMLNNKYGLINNQGILLAPLQYNDNDDVPRPHDGVVCVNIGTDDNRLYRCIDIDGGTLFTHQARVPIEFSEGLASVWNNNGYSVIDKSGNIVIPTGEYESIWDFKEGVAKVSKGSLYGFINKSGDVVVPLKYSYINDESFPVVIAHSDQGVVCLDARTGSEITPLSKDKSKYNTTAYLNTDNMVIIDVKDTDTIYLFDTLSCCTSILSNIKEHWRFSNGLCAVVSKKRGQSGFIDRAGALVIPYAFDGSTQCATFHRGICAINGKIINKNGETLRRIPKGHSVRYSSPNIVENGFWIEEGNDIVTSKYGRSPGMALLNDSGRIVYKGFEIYGFRTDSLIAVKRANVTGKEKWGYINRDGKLVIQYQFADSSSFSEGFTTVDEPVKKKKRATKKRKPAKDQDGCYIATSIYGSYDTPEVWVLRRYRDIYLSEFAFGRAFIKLYYRISPTLVKVAGDTNLFKCIFKPILNRFVKLLQSKGYSSAPYSDTNK